MKKQTKIALLIIAVLTVVTVAASIFMLRAVAGDALLYMDSRIGRFYALTYRWFLVAGVVFVLFWAALITAKRKVIAAKLAGIKAKASPEAALSADKSEKDSEKVKNTPKGGFCTSCGKQLQGGNKFCTFCGTSIVRK